MTASLPRWLMGATALLGLGLLILVVAQSDPTTTWNQMVAQAMAVQRDLHRQLAGAMRAVEAKEAAAGWTLVGIGFLYGVFHAVGPGHGKVVIATYLATHESRLWGGVVLSMVSSLLQGLTAIGAVALTVTLLGRSFRDAQGTATTLESVSYGLVALLGLVLALRAGRRLWLGLRRPNADDPHGHGHHGDCGHGHGPTARDLAATPSVRHFVATVLAIGVRPCSGAVLVLVLAHALDLVWAGVAAALAMSAGTAITVSALATLSVYARRSALALAGLMATDGVWLGRALDALAVLGGLGLVMFGGALLEASLVIARHPLL